MHGLLLVSRCVLALVFLVAAVGKLMDLPGSRKAVEEFGVPAPAARIAGSLLPFAELLAAALLLIRPVAVVGAALSLALLLVFIAGMGYALSQGRAPECHCFGQIHSEPAGPSALIRNAVLGAIAILILAGGAGSSYRAAFTGLDSSQWALIAVSVLAAALAIAIAQLWSERTRLTKELERVRAAKIPPGLPRGAHAPAFALAPTADGVPGSLDGMLATGAQTVLVFLSTRCGPCLQLMPQLGAWQQGVSEHVTVGAILSGDEDEVRQLCELHELTGLIDGGQDLLSLYALRATPSAVQVASDGTIMSAPAQGAPAIEALIRSMLRTPEPPRGDLLTVHRAGS